MPRLVAAPDKFRGTADASDVAAAVGRAGRALGWDCDEAPLADGGEGTLVALGGGNRTAPVTGPLGHPVEAAWRLRDGVAVVEMALASGLQLVGGAEGNDPVQATTRGTGELIAAAVSAGARKVIVGVGGSATTDGGLAALQALPPPARLHGVRIVVACDVTTGFVDAAEEFAPQKGASAAQVALLRRRLERLAQVYEQDYGIDVRDLPGAGAAGGLAGALAAVGAELVPGFDVVADAVGLAERVAGADLVVTGEGYLDAHSLEGKVVGGVRDHAQAADVPLLVVVGEADSGVDVSPATLVALVDRCGREAALHETLACVEGAVRDHIASL